MNIKLLVEKVMGYNSKNGKSIDQSFLSDSYKCFLPKHYVIDTGNVCNLRCPFCCTGVKTPNIERGLISYEDFSTIFNKIKLYAEHIDLYNWGEPFLNKKILYMISLCAKYKIHSHIDSTLSSFDLTNEYAEDIVKSGISSIFVSIDGATQGVYQKYRVGGNLDRVFKNLNRLIKAKDRLNISTPKLGWAYYINKYNEHEIEKAQQIAKDIGINIWFKLLSCNQSWQSSLHCKGSKILDIPEWVNECYPLPHASQFDKLQFHDDVIKVIGACRQPFHTMVIDWNGDVRPCTSVTSKQFVIGNLLKDNLNDIWNNIEFRKSREFLINFDSNKKTNSTCERLSCPLGNPEDKKRKMECIS